MNGFRAWWDEICTERPGKRFEKLYHARRNRKTGRFPVERLVNVGAGFVIIAVGLALIPLPGPGWLIVFIGLGFIASEFLPVARLLDVTERKLRRWFCAARAAVRRHRNAKHRTRVAHAHR